MRGLVATAFAATLVVLSVRAEASGRTATLTVRGDADEAAKLEATIRELCARLGVDVVVGDGGTDIVARTQIDLSQDAEADIVVASGQDGHVIVHRRASRRGSALVVREEIGHTVMTAIESELLEHPPAPAPPAPPSPPSGASPQDPIAITPPAPTPTPTRDSAAPHAPTGATKRSSLALDVATFAGGSLFAKSEPVARVGAGATLASRAGLQPSIGLGATYAVPFETTSELVTSRSTFVSLRALGGITLTQSRYFALDAGVGGGTDILSVTPRSDTLPASSLGSETTRVDPIVTGALSVRVALVSSVTLDLAAVLDVAPTTRAYAVARGSDRSDVLVPSHVRPALMAGLSFSAIGRPRFDLEEPR